MVAAVAAVAAPSAAPRVAALLLAAVAVVYVGSRLRDVTVTLPVADERPMQSAPPPRPGTPADLTLLTMDLTTAKATNVISPSVAECLRDLAIVRIKNAHGLDARDPFTHEAVRPLVSTELFAVVSRSSLGARLPGAKPAPMPRYASLPALIDEVERL